jgi:hypothetical protein
VGRQVGGEGGEAGAVGPDVDQRLDQRRQVRFEPLSRSRTGHTLGGGERGSEDQIRRRLPAERPHAGLERDDGREDVVEALAIGCGQGWFGGLTALRALSLGSKGASAHACWFSGRGIVVSRTTRVGCVAATQRT